MANDDDSSILGGTPVVWVVFPLIFFFIVAAGMTLTVIRRRRHRAALYAHRHNHLNNPPPANHVWRSTSGWHTTSARGANGAGGGAGFGGSNGSEQQQSRGPGLHGYWSRAPQTQQPEGLNEFGEAPPPYMGGKAAEEGRVGESELPDYPAGPARTYQPGGH